MPDNKNLERRRSSPVVEKQVDSNIVKALTSVPSFVGSFEIIRKLGQGSFSTVILARSHEVGKEVAVKCLVPTTCPSKAFSELDILRKLGGRCNVIGLLCTFRYEDSIFFMMDYFPHDHFTTFVHDAKFDEIRDYMKNLLIALQHVHKLKIIHRDIKATNFLFNRTLRRYRLIDFGLAEHEEGCVKRKPDDSTNLENLCGMAIKRPRLALSQRSTAEKKKLLGSVTNRFENDDPAIATGTFAHLRRKERVSKAGTAGFRAPEVLLNYAGQTAAVDIWSAGVLFLGLLTRRYPFMKPKDDETALAQIISIFGSESLALLAKRIGKKLICQPHISALSIRKLILCIRLTKKEDLIRRLSENSIENLPKEGSCSSLCPPTQCEKCERSLYCPTYSPICFCKKGDILGCSNNGEKLEIEENFIEKSVALLEKMLTIDPKRRITAEWALKAEIFK
uniref:non-specific serine/threonine protein kinase n=1 Tax=Romanomermis culicivorax TaxID=13658 RepID=A0A915L0Y9_ROMCU